MAEPDARASARRHTAQLLKMLRGYGPVTEPSPAIESTPATVAEAAGAYAGRLETTPSRPPPTTTGDSHRKSPPRESSASIPTVGEGLSRRPGALGQLMARAERLVQMDRMFRAYLPAPLRDHAVLIRLDQDSWLVRADSPGWATRLRYALHNIRQALSQQLGIPLPKPRIRVTPAVLPPRPRPRLTLTEHNARLLEITARNISDARLSAALRRLAQHADPTARAPTE